MDLLSFRESCAHPSLNTMADKAKALARVKQENEEMEDCDSEHIM